MNAATTTPRARLEEIRAAIHDEHVSYGELAELADLVGYIAPGDLELLEWAGVEETDAQAGTYGVLYGPHLRYSGADVDAALTGYLEAGLWSTSNPDHETDPDAGEMLDADYSPADLPADYVAEERSRVRAFLEANAADLDRWHELLPHRPLDYVGHDLWLTQESHGAGFWDRYMEAENPANRDEVREIGDRLTAAAGNADRSAAIMEACWMVREGMSR